MVLARTRQAAGKPRGTGTQVKAVGKGKALLIAAVDKEIGEKSDVMAKKLIAGFLKGSVTSMKMLLALADERIDCENLVVMSQLCSYAETLEAEQQLTAGEAEAAEKTELGKGEPEG
jgi:hypothetical protein